MPDRDQFILTPEILLRAYASGIFPMAEDAQSTELLWFDPPLRGIIPLNSGFHIPRRLRKTIRQQPYRLTFDQSFADVMCACAAPTGSEDRKSTWINQDIQNLYGELHQAGHAHSIEARDENGALVGGLYGVSLGAAFFGESMFSHQADASKISLVYLVALLRHCGFILLDTQFQTSHLAQFGTEEIPRQLYRQRLVDAIDRTAMLAVKDNYTWHQLVLAALRPADDV